MAHPDCVFRSKRNTLFYIAEVGGNHEGNFQYALELTRLAAKSGADAVKFQLYEGNKLVSPTESPERNEHFKRFELKQTEYIELANYCVRQDVEFMASIWDVDKLSWIGRYLSYHKVGSGDLTCYPILAKLVETEKPIILSTGLATLQEIEATIRFIEKLDATYISKRKLALLQCTSAYPTPDEDANVIAMLKLKDAFGQPVGYSDHTQGAEAIELAATLGAEIIEKHFTDTREGKTFRDHLVSLTEKEVMQYLEKIRRFEVLRGDYSKSLTESEQRDGHELSFRRSIYAAKEIKAGDLFSEENLTVLRPKHGICASQYYELLGRRAARDIKPFEVLKNNDIVE